MAFLMMTFAFAAFIVVILFRSLATASIGTCQSGNSHGPDDPVRARQNAGSSRYVMMASRPASDPDALKIFSRPGSGPALYEVVPGVAGRSASPLR